MDFKYVVSNLKTGKHLACITWIDHYSLACKMKDENDNNVYVWIKNDLGEDIICINITNEEQVWDCTDHDTKTDQWVMVIDFEIQHLNKLLKDPSIVKVTSLQNKKYTVQYGEVSTDIYFVHELLNFCIDKRIEINIDIKKKCLMEFLQE